MGHWAVGAPVYMAFATYVPALRAVVTTLHSFWERWRSHVGFQTTAAPGWTTCEPVGTHWAQSAVDQISSLPDTIFRTRRASNTTTQAVGLELVTVTSKSAMAVAATVFGPVIATDRRFAMHSVGATGELAVADVLLAVALGVTRADVVGTVVG